MIPLFIADDVDSQLWDGLPRYQHVRTSDTGGADSKEGESNPHQPRIKRFVREILQSAEPLDQTVPAIIVALHLVFEMDPAQGRIDLKLRDCDTADDQSRILHLLLKQSWCLVQDRIDFDVWEKFVSTVCSRICVVGQEHPLIAYAVNQVPHLSPSALESVVDILKLKTNSRSPLAIQKLIRDRISADQDGDPVRYYAVLPPQQSSNIKRRQQPNNHDDDDLGIGDPATYILLHDLPHSCIPTAQLELLCDGTVSLTALYDIGVFEKVSICYIRAGGTFEQRDTALQQRFGHSCHCLRCRYEMITESDDQLTTMTIHETLSRSEIMKLGHYYTTQGSLIVAKRLYNLALQQQSDDAADDTAVADLCHALGAIELSMGKFLAAQRIWKQAADDYRDACYNHAGISLQVEKLKAFGYPIVQQEPLSLDLLKEHADVVSSLEIAAESPTMLRRDWESPLPGVFVVHVLDETTCQQVISWAERLGTWTQQRHYEVPTYDVPVHTVPPLLQWFQHKFMTPIMQDLLARQFDKKEHRFYVHDAFCVRYEAGCASNHLPVHTDESTHSFVLALNNDFEGGGTYFFDHDKTIRIPIGSVLSFCGDRMPHGGEAVIRGCRYVLAVFLYYDEGLDRVEVKRPAPGGMSQLLRETKQQKTEFSFGFMF